MARIGEFQSFNFHAEGAFQIVLTLGIAMLGAALALDRNSSPTSLLAARADLCRAALGSGFASGGADSAARSRTQPLRARLRAPRSAPRSSRRDRFRARLLGWSAGHRRRFSGLALAPVVAVLLFALLRTPAIAARTGFPPDQFPVAAAAEVDKLPAAARILAPDKFGGYLIYRFRATRKVFFDGRSDLYGSEFLKQYARLTQLRPGWRAQLDEFGFTHALLPNDYSLVPALEALGWKRLYRDETGHAARQVTWMLPLPIRVTLTVVVLIAAFTDLQSRRIPNWLTLPALPVGLLAQTVYGDGFWQGLLGALGGFLALFLLFRRGRGRSGRREAVCCGGGLRGHS